MGVNLESRQLYRLRGQQPDGQWSRELRARGDRPVRIHTLGRFTIQVENHPLIRSGASRQRPFGMLQALIAFGGRDVHEDLLTQALWPDAEGDHASNTFNVTLHRLRRLFAVPGLFILRDHHLSLNGELTWVDAWAFEQLVNHCARLLDRPTDPDIARQLARCEERLLTLYQGAFLEREASPNWSLTLRERLRSKLLRHLIDAGQLWENRGETAMALRLYQKGLEIEPFAEILYQRLMSCLYACGRIGDALATFHRCRQMLADQFQTPPSPGTIALYTRLKAAS